MPASIVSALNLGIEFVELMRGKGWQASLQSRDTHGHKWLVLIERCTARKAAFAAFVCRVRIRVRLSST